MSYVIGIDPSITATGVCLLHSDKKPEFHTIGTTKHKRSIDGDGDMPLALRLWHLSACLMGTLPANSQPLLAAIETPISPLALGKFGGTGFNNNIMSYGVAYEMLGKFRIPYVNISTKQRAVIATGNGNADKGEVMQAIFDKTPIQLSVLGDDNQVDAYWLAMGAAEVRCLFEDAVDYPKRGLKRFVPHGGYLELSDKAYDMLEKLEIERP